MNDKNGQAHYTSLLSLHIITHNYQILRKLSHQTSWSFFFTFWGSTIFTQSHQWGPDLWHLVDAVQRRQLPFQLVPAKPSGGRSFLPILVDSPQPGDWTTEIHVVIIWATQVAPKQKNTFTTRKKNNTSKAAQKKGRNGTIHLIPSRELTYPHPPKMAFWRWFSFSQGGIC